MDIDIAPGITSIIGGGGKTTLMLYLAKKYSRIGRVIVCTTTKIYQPEGIPLYQGDDIEELAGIIKKNAIVCVGNIEETRDNNILKHPKLTSSNISMSMLKKVADFIFVEADGSKGLPLKVHADYEPVIPDESNNVIWVIGADCFGKKLREVCHRYELYVGELSLLHDTLCKQKCGDDDIVTPALVVGILEDEINKKTILKHYKDNKKVSIYVNKVESDLARFYFYRFKELLRDDISVSGGSLLKFES